MHKKQNFYNLFTLDQTSSKLSLPYKIRDVQLPNVKSPSHSLFDKFSYNGYGCLINMRRPTSKCEITIPFLWQYLLEWIWVLKGINCYFLHSLYNFQIIILNVFYFQYWGIKIFANNINCYRTKWQIISEIQFCKNFVLSPKN